MVFKGNHHVIKLSGFLELSLKLLKSLVADVALFIAINIAIGHNHLKDKNIVHLLRKHIVLL